MFDAGKVTTLLQIQVPSGAVDSMGAPEFGWAPATPALFLYAYPENELNSQNSLSDGPREEAIRTLTFVTRNSPDIDINVQQRLLDTEAGVLYRILAIRYDAKKTTCFIDVESGVAHG